MSFIDEHRDRFGSVEPICSALTKHGVSIAPSTYSAAKARPPSARTMRDTELKALVREVFDANYRVYGARKIWHHLRRQGHQVARCTIERLMRELGITGAVRGRKVVTAVQGRAAEPAPDLIDRDFVADAPNRTWVADFTHVAAWAGTVCVACARDVGPEQRRRRVVPRRVKRTLSKFAYSNIRNAAGHLPWHTSRCPTLTQYSARQHPATRSRNPHPTFAPRLLWTWLEFPCRGPRLPP